MMRTRNPQSQEDGFHLLRPHAAQHISALIHDFQLETDHGLKCWLLELIGEARAPESFSLLCDQLRSDDPSLRDWAVRGLQALDTPDARRELFAAGFKRGSAG
jgi:hypothetical protein